MDYLNATTCTNVPIYNFSTNSCVPNNSTLTIRFSVKMCSINNTRLWHDLVPTVTCITPSDSSISNVNIQYLNSCVVFVKESEGRFTWGSASYDLYFSPGYINCAAAKCCIGIGISDVQLSFIRNNICYSYVMACSDVFKLQKCEVGKWTQCQVHTCSADVMLYF